MHEWRKKINIKTDREYNYFIQSMRKVVWDSIPSIQSLCFSLDLERPSGTCLTWITLKSIYLHTHDICGCFTKCFFSASEGKIGEYLQKHYQTPLSQPDNNSTAQNAFGGGTWEVIAWRYNGSVLSQRLWRVHEWHRPGAVQAVAKLFIPSLVPL